MVDRVVGWLSQSLAYTNVTLAFEDAQAIPSFCRVVTVDTDNTDDTDDKDYTGKGWNRLEETGFCWNMLE